MKNNNPRSILILILILICTECAYGAALFLVYVGGMLSITYFSFIKPSFFSDTAKVASPV